MGVTVLAIGGMDSSGGAGLLRDALTLHRMGVGVRLAVTAVTAQTDQAVMAVEPVSGATITAQMRAAGQVGAVKTGMLVDADRVRIVAKTLVETLSDVPVVVDPVIKSTSGRYLMSQDGLAALVDTLIPRTTVLTPNLPELAVFARYFGLSAEATVSRLLSMGCCAVLIKGGHSIDQKCVDVLWRATDDPVYLQGDRFPINLRGTGCQLASAIAAGLACGNDIARAVVDARAMIEERFQAALADQVP